MRGEGYWPPMPLTPASSMSWGQAISPRHSQTFSQTFYNRNYNFQWRKQSLTMSKLLDTTSSRRSKATAMLQMASYRPCRVLLCFGCRIWNLICSLAASDCSMQGCIHWPGPSASWGLPWLQPVNGHSQLKCTKGLISGIQGKLIMFVCFLEAFKTNLILSCVSVISPVISDF